MRQQDFTRNVRRDWDEMIAYFVDDRHREELRGMNPVKKVFVIPYWLFKAMYLRLTPARRILLLIAVIFILFDINTRVGEASLTSGHFIGLALLLFILLLELKDKLLARDELEAGRAVQMALMPEQHPQFEGWDIWIHSIPANDVGGDLVDHLPTGRDRLGIALGDVAGKGLGAALFMARLQATLRALAPARQSIAELGAELSAIFDRDGIPNRFASLIYLEITRNCNDIVVLNAGHMPPLLVNENTVREMPRGGPALGVIRYSNYEEQQITVNPGELLFVYSDGLTEARNAQGEFFGEDRLHRLLARLRGFDAARLGQHVIERIHRFTGDRRSHDDLSLLVLRRLPPGDPTPPS
jgi:phosphoserine phosphatase RsbU/P